ncbi:HET-domain-containing protein [Amniculicola lignicola CBS 123094]|uniref:HET-domain-containing protein n=1 Tax=Amniculicola lignicola CBS 123094 TaxID=1392246 RepID=A0A6A5WC12_9PLEO|nr:HET-domain-containing protein [Amniculicola lignicola CBS 123094]
MPCPQHLTENQDLRQHSLPDTYLYDSTLSNHMIRLLQLGPGMGDDPIRCSLVEKSLDQEFIYNALSYTWGDPTRTRTISCEGQRLVITESLHAALWQFREDGRVTPLWVDAVCINQANTDEKSVQVGIMREIYQRAYLVIAWLGEATDTDAAGFTLLRDIHERFGPPSLGDELVVNFAQNDKLGLPELDHPDWAALFKILCKPYFFRVWIIQELIVGRACIFQCGSEVISRDILLAIGALGDKVRFLQDAEEANTPYDGVSEIAVRSPVRELWYLKSLLDTGKHLTILQLLVKTRAFKATQAHDKIFALVGLSSNVSTDIIDYKESIAKIQTMIAIISMRNRESWGANLLCYVDSGRHADNIPSWVPDWTGGGPVPKALCEGFQNDGLTQSLSKNWRVSPTNKLALHCRTFDTVKTVVQATPWMVPSPSLQDLEKLYSSLSAMEAWDDECWALVTALERYPTGQSIYDAYWRTLAFNTDCTGVEAPEELENVFAVWQSMRGDFIAFYDYVKEMQREAPADGHAEPSKNTNWGWGVRWVMKWATWNWRTLSKYVRIQQMMAKAKRQAKIATRFDPVFKRYCFGRKFCITVNGYMGWVASSTVPGDRICSFEGSCIPFVLREAGYGARCFSVVGDCYLHGLTPLSGNSQMSSLEPIVLV